MGRTSKRKNPVCYLCGEVIDKEFSRDHVPPRQFYSAEIRKLHSPNLQTMPTHISCNNAYQRDEEYFIHSIAPLVQESYAGKSVLRELTNQYKSDRNSNLAQKILGEFEQQPSGIILPPGKIVKRLDPDRIWRVVWKITRGLFYHEHGKLLREDTPKTFSIVAPGERPPDEFFLIPDDNVRGQYPGVLDYKYRVFPEMNNMHFWALLLWDQLIMMVVFHDPNCECETCVKT